MRYIYKKVQSDFVKYNKIAFIAGPRQVGKTTLSLYFLGDAADESHPAYFNWDNDEDRNKVIKGHFPSDQPLIILDEIHKFHDWRRLVKSLYDKTKSKKRYIVTGSARLDHYRHGGDSLMGRYFFYRLHPLSPMEIDLSQNPKPIENLMMYSGFPEPFFNKDSGFLKRWQNERRKRVMQEDLMVLERVVEIKKLSLLMTMLPARIGSLLSLRSIAEDLSTSHNTIEKWITILENLYYCFRVSPWGSKEIVRALKKEQKLFLWDWSQVRDEGARFENLVASILLKYIHRKEDFEGEVFRLHFLRDKEKREINFIVTEQDGTPIFAVECKSKNKNLSKHLEYFSGKIPSIPMYQVSLESSDSWESADGRIRVMSFKRFCREVLAL